MKHKDNTRVNKVILDSIPINRKIKRYWVDKYKRIATNCGIDEAQRKIKNLRVQVMSYLADSNRRSNFDLYLKSTGFKQNGMLRKLFELADCQPHYVLSFLKLYTSWTETTMTVDQAAFATKQRLDSVVSYDGIPTYLKDWFDILALSRRHRKELYIHFNDPKVSPYLTGVRYARSHSYQEWQDYWSKWYSIIHKGWKSEVSSDSKCVFPEVYKDYNVEDQTSEAYSADFADLVSMHMVQEESPLTRDELDFVSDCLDEEIQDQLYSILWGESPGYSGLFRHTSILSGLYVGHVHHIKKKGGGTELRDIAVPNRFIQQALNPGAKRLYSLLHVLPTDASFNQNRFDKKITNRVTNSALYQGSVDLSKATDNLPLSWGWYVIERIIEIFGNPSDEELKSLQLFKTVARANWEDQGYFIKWKVGQPLGSLPSFATLGLTHNFVTESLSMKLGLGHSPYSILGDDIVLFNKKLRKKYISELTTRRIPLSLHKSFEGRLSEFAGKIFVVNCIPFYCSDHNSITWNSLFDWQISTGIRIPWGHLPKKLQRKIQSVVKSCRPYPEGENNSSKLASLAYSHAQSCLVHGRGSIQFPDTGMMGNPDIFFEYIYSSEESPVCGIKSTGITLIGNGHPVVLMNSRFADKDGFFERYRPVQLPQWYKDKVRPCATDIAIRGGLSSYFGYCVSESRNA